MVDIASSPFIKKIRSDQPVSRILYPGTVTRSQGNDHSSRMHVAVHLMQPTRKLGRAALKRFSIWSCTGRGLPSFSSHLENWCALTAPFHPYRAKDAAVYFLLHLPAGRPGLPLAITVLCGVRTFLDSRLPRLAGWFNRRVHPADSFADLF